MHAPRSPGSDNASTYTRFAGNSRAMSSGSLKDLTKALNASIPTISLPLPPDILQVIHGYLEKHSNHDESDSHRLHDELLSIYQNLVVDNSSRLAPFLAIMRNFKSVLRGSGRLLLWWEKLAIPIINKLGEEKGLAEEAKNTLLDILVEDEEDEDSIATSSRITDDLIGIWLKNNNIAMTEFDDQARFVEGQMQSILLAFGRRRPKTFLTAINKFFVRKDSRILTLGLLCEFIRHQPPHLHQLLQTPLFDNLLRCLQIDTSTRAISLAMTALVMFLPHIPSSLGAHLPALFNIYSRMLFWDRERRAASVTSDEPDDEKREEPRPVSDADRSWTKLPYLLESDDDTVPELLHYFTFLYGLYPINFMSYIRKPQKYLRHANFPGADDLDVEPTEIRERSETFREVHLLHPNFFIMTIESELTDNNRWMKSEAADVVAECMALYSPGEEGLLHASRSKGLVTHKTLEQDVDIPEEPLLDEPSNLTPYQSRHTSWRNTQSTAVASPEPYRTSHLPGLNRKASQTSQSIASIADSPALQPTDRIIDSPTLPPQLMSGHVALKDILTSQASARGSMYRSMTNDSVQSFTDSHNPDNPFHVDADFESLARAPVPRSPSLRPTHADPSIRISYLHREIQLLHNDLNFERYLKQQHLSHIGQLRRKQIREARVEAETQNLINSNRALKSRVEELKKSMLQMKRETEKSKSHSRKWEADLSSKLRLLREEQKKWTREKEELNSSLGREKEDSQRLLDLVISAEARELYSQQKMQSIETNLDEMEHMKAEVEKLTKELRTYEANDRQTALDKENSKAASKEVEILKMKLKAQDQEMLNTRLAIEKEVREACKGGEASNTGNKKTLPHDVLDSALAVSRKRIIEIQKSHNHLLSRYNQLQEDYVNLKESHDQHQPNYGQESPPLLSRTGRRAPFDSKDGYRSSSPTPVSSYSGAHSAPGSAQGKPSQIDTSYFAHSRHESRDGGMGSATQGAMAYHFGPQGPNVSGSYGSDHSLDGTNILGKPKIKQQSELRFYGRGGIQNISKKNKEGKDSKDSKDSKDGKDGKDGKDKGKGKGKEKEREPTSPAVDGTQSIGKKKKGILGSFGTGLSSTPGYL